MKITIDKSDSSLLDEEISESQLARVLNINLLTLRAYRFKQLVFPERRGKFLLYGKVEVERIIKDVLPTICLNRKMLGLDKKNSTIEVK